MDQPKWGSERVWYVSKEMPGRVPNPKEYFEGMFFGLQYRGLR